MMDTVKISIAPVSNNNAMFAEEFTMEFNVIQKIGEAKVQYQNALEAYFDGVLKGIYTSINSDTINSFERVRLDATYRKYVALYKHYCRILNNFSIESLKQVSYMGVPYSLHESIRRFTQTHLEELSEIEQIHSAPVVSTKNEYEALVREYLHLVRFSYKY